MFLRQFRRTYTQLSQQHLENYAFTIWPANYLVSYLWAIVDQEAKLLGGTGLAAKVLNGNNQVPFKNKQNGVVFIGKCRNRHDKSELLEFRWHPATDGMPVNQQTTSSVLQTLCLWLIQRWALHSFCLNEEVEKKTHLDFSLYCKSHDSSAPLKPGSVSSKRVLWDTILGFPFFRLLVLTTPHFHRLPVCDSGGAESAASVASEVCVNHPGLHSPPSLPGARFHDTEVCLSPTAVLTSKLYWFFLKNKTTY